MYGDARDTQRDVQYGELNVEPRAEIDGPVSTTQFDWEAPLPIPCRLINSKGFSQRLISHPQIHPNVRAVALKSDRHIEAAAPGLMAIDARQASLLYLFRGHLHQTVSWGDYRRRQFQAVQLVVLRQHHHQEQPDQYEARSSSTEGIATEYSSCLHHE